MNEEQDNSRPGGATSGLRYRKKAERREKILDAARELFAEQGVDATTMADIARSVEVSTPTVFNYFGNKDGILVALITEGAQSARENSKVLEPRTDVDFLTILMTIFMDISIETMAIASKRIWRYAQAAAMRHPRTDLGISFWEVDGALLDLIEVILARYTLSLHDGSQADARHVASLFHNIWSICFQDFIRLQEMTIETHEAELRERFEPLCQMIFSCDFLASPTLKADGRAKGD